MMAGAHAYVPSPGANPYPPADWREREERDRAAAVAVQRRTPDMQTLGRVLAALQEPPVYAATMAARSPRNAGPYPVIAPAGLPGDGALRGLLARMASAEAGRLNPVFHASCDDCAKSGGWCSRHQEKRDEHEFFARLAARFLTAVSDEDADFLLRATATGNDLRIPADSGWDEQRERVNDLLTEAENNALPELLGCCTDDKPCDGHAKAAEAASLVGALRDAVIDAATPHEAAQLIAMVIAGGK